MPTSSRPPSRRGTQRDKRPVLYQLCRAGERFEVGDGPIDLSDVDGLILGRGDPQRSRMGKFYIDDPWMSSNHARVYKDRQGRLLVEDLGSTNGVLINGQQLHQDLLHHGDILETGRTFWLFFYEPDDVDLPIEPYEFGTWSTWSPRLARDLERLEKRIESSRHVLISGPEGSGKGFLARTVHLMSGRAGRLVHLDCRERRPRRLVVDIFGGPGEVARLREADLGTLFLENIEVLPLELQEQLADTLKRGSYTPEGKSRRVTVDVRVVGSTAEDVDALVEEGKLHKRLYEVLSQIRVDLPGLEGRAPDLGLLLDDFLARARGAPALSREACRAVLLHDWHLHVKSFQRVIESAAVLALQADAHGGRGGRVELEHLPLQVVGKETLRTLLPPEPMARPPSFQAPLSSSAEEVPQEDDDPERTHFREGPGTRSELLSSDDEDSGFDEAQLTDQLPASPGVLPLATGSEFELDPTDPTVARPSPGPPVVGVGAADDPVPDRIPARVIRPAAAVRPATGLNGPAVRALDEDEPPALPQARPPSAYHDLQSMERSYASAVDPDLIVDALRRARGNVSGAARYLGKPRATLLRWIKEFHLDPEDYRDG